MMDELFCIVEAEKELLDMLAAMLLFFHFVLKLIVEEIDDELDQAFRWACLLC